MPVKIIQAIVAAAVMAFVSPVLGQAPTLEIKTASELPIWKTITLGVHRNVNAVRDALDAAKITVGDSADEILGRPAFTFANERRELNLVVLSVTALGFGADGGTLADIHARALRLGFELCPEEVGPQLRLQYFNQPVGEFLHVAMKPQLTYQATPSTSPSRTAVPDYRCWAAARVPTLSSRRAPRSCSFVRAFFRSRDNGVVAAAAALRVAKSS